MARIFLAGASGIIGQQLIPMLVRAGHHVTGTTRSEDEAKLLQYVAEPSTYASSDRARHDLGWDPASRG